MKLLAVFPQFVQAETAHKFLDNAGVHVDEVQQLRLRDMGISGTPTLLLLDDSGTVLDAWVGKLLPGEEEEVIAAVKVQPELHAEDAKGADARDVVISTESRWDAVKILRIDVAGRDVLPGRYLGRYLPGRRFAAGDNWFQDLSFTFKNRTSKTIVFVGFTIMFSEGDSSEDAASWWLNLGKVPDISYSAFHPPDDNVPQGTGKPLQFAPGAVMTISLGRYAETMRRWFEERGHSLASIKTCAVLFSMAYFEDGMRWNPVGGYPSFYEYIDERMPDSWIKGDDFYFPGQLNPVSRIPSMLDPLTPDNDM